MKSIRRLHPRVLSIVPVACGLVLFGTLRSSERIHAQQSPQPLPPSYTTEQAEKGQDAFTQHCASCHGPNLDDGAYGPPLKGADFRQRWGSRSAEPLFTYTSTKMPPARPGTLGDATYAQVLA